MCIEYIKFVVNFHTLFTLYVLYSYACYFVYYRVYIYIVLTCIPTNIYTIYILYILRCNSPYEAYSASYLTTSKHILAVKSEEYNLTWVNCEMASFTHMRNSGTFYTDAHAHSMIIQTLDILDFSVIHLSAYERIHKRHQKYLYKTNKERRTAWSNIDIIQNISYILESNVRPTTTTTSTRTTTANNIRTSSTSSNTHTDTYTSSNTHTTSNGSKSNIVYDKDTTNKTVVIMPFLGGSMGAGHSVITNRYIYLSTCFWSFYTYIPYIVISVTRKEDVIYLKKYSNLPFYDILLLDNLPKSAALPMATGG